MRGSDKGGKSGGGRHEKQPKMTPHNAPLGRKDAKGDKGKPGGGRHEKGGKK